jgi:hypothetical protein
MPLTQRVAALVLILAAVAVTGEPASKSTSKSKATTSTAKAPARKSAPPYKTAAVTLDLRAGEKTCRQQTIRIDVMQHSIIGGYQQSATLPDGLAFEATNVAHSHEELTLGQSKATVTTGSALVIDYCVSAARTLAPATYTGEGKIELTIGTGIPVGTPATLQFKVNVAAGAQSVSGPAAVSPAAPVSATPAVSSPPTVPAPAAPRATAPATGPRIPSRPSPAPPTDLFGVQSTPSKPSKPAKPAKPEVYQVKGEPTELAGMNEFSISVGRNEAGLHNIILQVIRRELPHLVFHPQLDELDDAIIGRTILLRFAGAGKTNRLWVFRPRGHELRTLAEFDVAYSAEESAKTVAERFVKLYRKHNPDWRNRTPAQPAPVVAAVTSDAPVKTVSGLEEVIGDPAEMRGRRQYFLVSKDPEVIAAFDRVVSKALPQLSATDPNTRVSPETLCITFRRIGNDGRTLLGEMFRVTADERRILTTVRLDNSRGKIRVTEELAREFVKVYREANR